MIAIAKDDAEAQVYRRRRKIARRWLIGFLVLLIGLTHFPNPYPRRGEPEHYDKVVHFTLYGALGALALRMLTLRAEQASAVTRCVGILAAVAAFGLLDEATQPLTGRDFDWFDWLADILGAVGGVLAYEALRRRKA